MSLNSLQIARRGSLFLLTAGLALAFGCSQSQGEVTFSDDLYADALEFIDANTGEVCEPDMETYIGFGDQGGDTAQGVPTTSPDEDRQGGDDNQYGGNGGGGDGEHADTADADVDPVVDADADADPVEEVVEEEPIHEFGPGCDAFGCCNEEAELIRERDRVRCRCRLRVRGAEEFVLPECCELEEVAEMPLETDDDMPLPPAPDNVE